MEIEEKNIAQCYFYQSNDEANKCELTNLRLKIINRNRSHEFITELVNKLTTQNRKLLIPLLFSGVFTPLVVLGYFGGYFHPLLAIILIVTGVFSFYYGWLGQLTLTVHYQSGHRDFSLSRLDEELAKFVLFINSYITSKSEEKKLLFAFVEYDQENNLEGFKDKSINFFTFVQFQKHFLVEEINNKVLLLIDPLKLDTKFQLNLSAEGDFLVAASNMKLNESAIVKIVKGDELQKFISSFNSM